MTFDHLRKRKHLKMLQKARRKAMLRGSRQGRTPILGYEQIFEIKIAAHNGSPSQSELAAQYGVHRSTISRIIRGALDYAAYR